MNSGSRPSSFAPVTELPGAGATREQLSMLYTRYRLAGQHGVGRDVLEVACGAGIGLGYLAGRARMLVAGDYDAALLGYAAAARTGGARLVRLDAHTLPFRDHAFDLVVLFEALYYLAAPEQFVREARRVLRPGGVLLVCTANHEAPGFAPSRFATQYFTVPELHRLLTTAGFVAEVYGGHPVRGATVRDRAIILARRIATALGLIPSTLHARGFLKRLVYGRLAPIPTEVYEDMAEPSALVPLRADRGTTAYRVVFAVGSLP